MAASIQRLNYYNRQFLGAEDFNAEQAYHRDMRSRHNLGPHTWGIVAGLDLTQVASPGGATTVDITLQPGLAVDGFGREIVLLEPFTLTTELFAAFTGVGFRSLYIGYDEELTRAPRAGYEACDSDRFSRRQESYRLVVEAASPTHDEVIVAGTAVTTPVDLSIPYQQLPAEDDGARWLVLLGRVLWNGGTLEFLKADPVDVASGRRYVSAVAEAVLSPAGRLLLRGRNQPSPLTAADPGVAVEIEGSLQTDRRLIAKNGAELHGSDLDFRNDNGVSPAGQFAIRRIDPGGAAGVDLQIKIGAESAGKNRLLVTSDATRLSVTDKGDVSLTGRATLGGGFESRGDSAIVQSKKLTMEGGPIEFKATGAGQADWAVRVVSDDLQFVEPDDGNRVAFEVLDTSAAETSPCVRLHGNAQATLSAQQLIDLTRGGVTTLHHHPLRLLGNTIVRAFNVAPGGTDAQTLFVPAPPRNVVAAIFLTTVDPSAGVGGGDRVRARIIERDGVALGGTPAVYTGPAGSLRFELSGSANMAAAAIAVILFEDA